MSDNATVAELVAKEVEKRLNERGVPKRTQGKAPDDVPLAVCNAVAERAQKEILAEKRDAATLAKAAIDAAFAGKGRRVQKPISGVVSVPAPAAKK